MNQFEIIIQPKPEVLDPEARAIHDTLSRQGVGHLKSIKVSKRYVIEIDASLEAGTKIAEQVAKDYLVNPVAQNYQVKKI